MKSTRSERIYNMSKCHDSHNLASLNSQAITKVENAKHSQKVHANHAKELANVQSQLDQASWYSAKVSSPSHDDLLRYPILNDDY